MENHSLDQKYEALFFQLVLTFQSAAWQQMGKLKNPMTDKIERDLNQARFSIDMLEMIRVRTQGNLTENEKALIDRAISELQLNYISEFDKEKKEEEQKETEKLEDKEQDKKAEEVKEGEKSGTEEKKKTAEAEKPSETKSKKGGKRTAKKK